MAIKARSAKAKGTRLEKRVVQLFEDAGARQARRQPGSGIYQDFPKDVLVEAGEERWIIECKARRQLPQTFERWLEGADMLVMCADRDTPRVYMRWETFAALLSYLTHNA